MVSPDKNRARENVPIVVAVYHREDDTSRTFEQLDRVTDKYSLIVVNNGYDDPDSLRGLPRCTYIENEENVGAIVAINQGLEAAEGKYACVLHNDVLIYEDGWLDHIIDFLERRPDVGMVGLAGRHAIDEEGRLDYETTLVNMSRYSKSFRPTWRFTEIATIDGLGWVMRNEGFRLDEGYGYMHYYDIDLSMQFIHAGYNIYCAGIELDHLSEEAGRSTRHTATYLDAIGGDDDAYFERACARFRSKWSHLLPISRGWRDEAYGYARVDELSENYRRLEKHYRNLEKHYWNLEKHYRNLEKYTREMREECEARGRALEKAGQYVRNLEAEIQRKNEMFEELKDKLKEAEARAMTPAVSSIPVSIPRKILYYIACEGVVATAGRARARLRTRK